jgi:hypothetical protein
MITFVIIIFCIALIVAFSMLAVRAWKLRTGRMPTPEKVQDVVPHVPFRQVEKTVLYLTKHAVVTTVVAVAKYWFIIRTKVTKEVSANWPKVHAWFQAKPKSPTARPSFIKRSVTESKIRIRRVKEKIRREHEEPVVANAEENKAQEDEKIISEDTSVSE